MRSGSAGGPWAQEPGGSTPDDVLHHAVPDPSEAERRWYVAQPVAKHNPRHEAFALSQRIGTDTLTYAGKTTHAAVDIGGEL